jgi:hypothetical protein
MVVGVLALPAAGYAQEATVTGTVTDSTSGVLPGVTITALHQASGNTFLAVTDDRGVFRLPVRTGMYQITVDLPGFTSVMQSLDLLLGQTAVLNLQLRPAALQETVTVTGEAPLIDTTQSTLSGNVDPRQLSELPVNGRNWLDLVMLAPGSKANAVGGAPVPRSQGMYQVNVDGQQVTQLNCCQQHQPGFSRDAIAEFEFVSTRFDATQGRSSGVQVNAITKSGSNTPAGTLSGYFRDSRLNAADFIQDRVVPYSDQQVSGTFGGPILRDRLHYFANYEYEREPQTYTQSSPFPSFNFDLNGVRRENKAGVRIDYQFSPQTRLSARTSLWTHVTPFDNRFTGGATLHASAVAFTDRFSAQVPITLTQVLSNRAVNEVRVGYSNYNWETDVYVRHAGQPFPGAQVMEGGSVRVNLRGYAIGTPNNLPQALAQKTYWVRDDFTTSFTKGGRHDVKMGAEYFYNYNWLNWCSYCNGVIDADNAPIPANIEQLFPVWNDASTWNLAALSPIAVRYRQGVGTYKFDVGRHISSGWFQDNWMVSPTLTVNLGVRYDVDIGGLAEKETLLPWLTGDRSADMNNVGPRLGFAYSASNRTVIRGGYGTYFTQMLNQPAHNSLLMRLILIPETPNDGRPDFAANPYNGRTPTYDEVERSLCSTALLPGCARRDITSPLPSPTARTSYSHQASLGVQRQLGDTMAVEADYVYTGSRAERRMQNINLSYNPATGANYPFREISRRPYQDWGIVMMDFMEGRSSSHGLQAGFTKRFSQRWQGSATYTLSQLKDDDFAPVADYRTSELVPFPVAPDLGGEYTLAATDQRHRAVLNGIWDVGRGLQLSGLYFFGSGERLITSYGGDLRNVGSGTTGRLRPDGSVSPRNDLVGQPLHRVDLRIQKRFALGGRATIDGMVEVFNLFNHENYGSYVTQESNRNYGQPAFNENLAYAPRMGQIGFRFAF